MPKLSYQAVQLVCLLHVNCKYLVEDNSSTETRLSSNIFHANNKMDLQAGAVV